jgi:hypothetical protein
MGRNFKEKSRKMRRRIGEGKKAEREKGRRKKK